MIKCFGIPAVIACAAALILGSPAPAQAQDPYVKLYNGHSGVFMVLDLGNRLNPGILSGEMATESQALGQYWNIVRGPDGLFRIRNRMVPGMCLDVAGDGVVYMDTCGNQIGQRWDVRPLGSGSFNLINQFRPGQCLDVTSAAPHIAMMAPCAGTTGQGWTATPTTIWP